MNNKKLLLTLLLFFSCGSLVAQNVALKTNALYWGVKGSPNLGAEILLSNRWTLDVDAGMNLWKLEDPKRFKHWAVEPEVRYWLCEGFNGHFFGLHALAAEFNAGGVNIPTKPFSNLKDHRYEGFAFGAGLSYGYQWPIAKRWNLEFNIGAGYAFITYDKYPCKMCGTKLKSDVYHYFGVTRAAVSLVYFIL